MAFKFDITKVICINIKSHNEQQLKNISEVYKLSYDALLRTKSNGTHRIWIEPGGDWAIAAQETSNTDDFYVCEKFCPITKRERDMLKKIQPIKTPKLKQPSNKISQTVSNASKIISTKKQIRLDLDSILDKINETGLPSLSQEELLFLQNYK